MNIDRTLQTVYLPPDKLAHVNGVLAKKRKPKPRPRPAAPAPGQLLMMGQALQSMQQGSPRA